MVVRQLKFLAPAMVAMVLVVGCGGAENNGAGTTGASTDAVSLPVGDTVSQAEVDRYQPGQPEHTALVWWRLAQINDPETALPLYADEPTLPNLAGQFNYVTADLAGNVKVVSTKVSGDTAKVTVKWDPVDGGPTKKTLTLEKVGPDWKLLPTRFVDELVEEKQKTEG